MRDVVDGGREVSNVVVQAGRILDWAEPLVAVEGLHEVQHRGLAVDLLLEREDSQPQHRHHLLVSPWHEDAVELASGGAQLRSPCILHKLVHDGFYVVERSSEGE